MDAQTPLKIRDVAVYPGYLTPAMQRQVVADVANVIAKAPLVHPVTRFGKKMSVGMTSAGKVGWVSTRQGYRYADQHPDGTPWPAIPASVLAIWDRMVAGFGPPDSCLINHYAAGARMGMHQDRDEADFTQPVVSVSLGDEALFRLGNLTRGGKTESLWLRSGDVVVMGGAARLIHHGIDRVRARSSQIVPMGGRLNLTLRVAGQVRGAL